MHANNFIQKSNPVIPVGLKVEVDDLKPSSYRLMMQAVDSLQHHAPDRIVDFDICSHPSHLPPSVDSCMRCRSDIAAASSESKMEIPDDLRLTRDGTWHMVLRKVKVQIVNSGLETTSESAWNC